jgi:pimeloyl-ACP methyl ester carboxylesterase
MKHPICCAVALAATLLLSACGTTPIVLNEAAPVATACPDGPPKTARCWRGQDANGAHYLIALPTQWSGVLVLHAHGGPSLGAPTAERADEDIKRWGITVREGHAWAGSVFRQGGFAVTAAAEDSERLRQIFVQHIAKPKRTLLHGQSWGAMVATKAGELYPNSWDGILLTSGVVAGPVTYDFRLDLRVLYQHLCNNHPRPSEPQYPLSLGLPPGSNLRNADLANRVDECLGTKSPAAQRTPLQQQRLKTLATVLRIPESSVLGHMNWGTFTLADIVHKRTQGASPFGNVGVRYQGSDNDAALNAAVLRYQPDPAASAQFAADTDHSGRFNVPVLTAHGINDATVFVEGSDTLRERMQAAGNGERLVQNFVNSSEHSYWGDANYPPLFEALLAWVNTGVKPTPQGIAARCLALQSAAGKDAKDCLFNTGYQVKPVSSRIYPR